MFRSIGRQRDFSGSVKVENDAADINNNESDVMQRARTRWRFV